MAPVTCRVTTPSIRRWGRTLARVFTVCLIGTYITSNRYQLDNGNTSGGTHWADPRMLSIQWNTGSATDEVTSRRKPHPKNLHFDATQGFGSAFGVRNAYS